MVASGLVWMALIASIISTMAYAQTATKKKYRARLARTSFLLMAAGVLSSSALLMVYILRHQFEFAYVWSYSARSLPTHLLVTTFWAGQEGSFMFWSLCSALIGFFLVNYTRGKNLEFHTMAVYSFLQSFLLLLLIAKSPFKFVWDEFPGQVTAGVIPADGRGLNPLLQNIWMIIHPPVLFLGFAVMAVPFSLAVAGLWRRAYDEWISAALPWVYFSAIALGAGLMLGGYWAYGVLGWGGWWGWDPVENSSLVPWIVAVMLLHTLVVQRKTGKLVRTNLILAMLGFILVIYSTFLTRSGILGDSSVHSFVDPGMFAYALLVLWISLVTGLSIALLAKRWTELKSIGERVGMMTRESWISIGAAAMGASALVILFGTSWPLFAKATVEPSFYDSMNTPIAIVMAAVLGVSLLIQWRIESGTGLAKRLVVPLSATLVASGIFFFAGVREPVILLLCSASVFALVINVQRGLRLASQSLALLGGVLSHSGLALLFLAIIASGHYGTKKTVSLAKGEVQEVLGYRISYLDQKSIDGGKHQFTLKAERNGNTFFLTPVMFQSSFNNSLMREPDYASFLGGDFYVEPVSLESSTDDTQPIVRLAKGIPVSIGDRTLTFLRFDMNAHGVQGMTAGKGFVIGAVVEVATGGKKELMTLASVFNQGSKPQPTPGISRDGTLTLSFVGMNVDMDVKQSSIEVSMAKPGSATTASTSEFLVAEVSIKPFMSFVWGAALAILGGLGLALYQHVRPRAIPAVVKPSVSARPNIKPVVLRQEPAPVEQP